MADVVDTLITEIVYRADTKAIEIAKKQEAELAKQHDATAKSLAELEKQQVEAAKTADGLAAAQIALREQLAKTKDETDALQEEQRQLNAEIKKAGKPTEEQAKRLKELDTRLKELKQETREYKQQVTALGVEQAKHRRTQNAAAREARDLTKKQNELGRSTTSVKEKIAKLSTALDKNRTSFRETAREIGSTAVAVGGLATAAAGTAIAGVIGLGREVITTGVSFESLRAQLKTVEGSSQGAARAFGLIQEFTKSTPFQLDEVTTAYIRLKNLGLDASKESLTSFGNIAAAQGKTIVDSVEAVADASTGEFERLKEFGIKASKQGEQVTFTFKGQQTVVKNTAADIQAFLKGIGDSDFAGAMADQMATTAGAISNLKDTIASFFDQVAQLGVLDEFKLLLADVSEIAGGNNGFAEVIAALLVNALRSLREMLAQVTAEDIRGFLMAAMEAVKGIAEALLAAVKAFMEFSDAVGGAEEATKILALGMTALVTAMMGPAGLVVAAGAVGVAIGRMVAGAILGMDELNDRIAKQEERILALQTAIAKSDQTISEIENRVNQRQEDLNQKNEARAKQDAERVKRAIGGLGAGLVQDLSAEDQAFRLRQIQKGSEAQQKQGREALLTGAGQTVFAAVQAAETQRINEAVKQAEEGARKSGGDVEAAGNAARQAAQANVRATREKAFKKATEVYAQTGSAEKAAAAAVAFGERKKTQGEKDAEKAAKKAAKEEEKGYKQTLAYDVEQQLEKNARQLAQTRASRALQRGEIGPGELANYEAQQYTEILGRTTSRYQETGQLPAGIAQNLKQIGRLPNEADLVGRTTAPVVSIQNNRYEITGNEFTTQVEGQFATTAQEVARLSLHEFRRNLNMLLGEAVPTPEKR